MDTAGRWRLSWRPYGFALPRQLITSQGVVAKRSGWLLRLDAADGRRCWGEAPLWTPQAADAAEAALVAMPATGTRRQLEQWLVQLPAPLAFALGTALVEADGLGAADQGGWLAAPESAWLLPAGDAMLPALEAVRQQASARPFTVKWKVAAKADRREFALLDALLELLPANSRLRLDANGGWDRRTAHRWADRLKADPRLEWLEQPLAPADHTGLQALAVEVPVALDESLREQPALVDGPLRWLGWQVRRPAMEGDPRPLLQALQAGVPRLMLSTAFETGIGRRLLAHLAALQAQGSTPAAPGLAPGWRPAGDLFADDPQQVWEAAR